MKFLVTENQFRIVISDIENHLLNEGVNDEEALRILKDSGMENYEEIFNFLKGKDTSKNNKSLPAMVSFYLNVTNNNDFTNVIKTFKKLSMQPNAPDVILDKKSGTVKVLNNSFNINEFSKFKEFVDHYYYKESEEDTENEKKLLSSEQNIIFENDKFLVYEAPSPQVCIDLFGKDNENRKYVERSFCIGAGSFDAPGSWYPQYRDPSGSWRVTFYVIVDKEKFKEYRETDQQDDTMLVVLGVRHSKDTGEIEYLGWDRNNSGPGDKVGNFGSAKNYVEHLKENGVNIRAFLPKPFIDLSDKSIDSLVDRWSDDNLFDGLTPKQKYKYVNEKARALTPHQVKFIMKFMPPALITNFVKNFYKLGNIPIQSFELLTNNLKKSYINSKLIQLYTNSNLFDEDEFFKIILSNDELKKYATLHIINSLSSESRHPNHNKEDSKKLLGFLDPKSFFETLKGETIVTLNNSNIKTNELPDNFGDYLLDVVELEIKNLNGIKQIPDSIGKCKNLTTLHIFDCQNLENIPDTIGQLTNLDDLIVGKCALKNIPNTIGNLKNLTAISFQDNKISSIPESLSNCTSLNVARFDNNNISKISKNIFFKEGVSLETDETNPDATKLGDLTFLSMTDNPLTEEDKELLYNFENITGCHVST